MTREAVILKLGISETCWHQNNIKESHFSSSVVRSNKARSKLEGWRGKSFSVLAEWNWLKQYFKALFCLAFGWIYGQNPLLIKFIFGSEILFSLEISRIGSWMACFSGDHLCLPKDEVGLGLKWLYLLNKSCLLKFLWNVVKKYSLFKITQSWIFFMIGFKTVLPSSNLPQWCSLDNWWWSSD